MMRALILALALAGLSARAEALCVLCGCDVDADPALSFGVVNPIAGQNVDAAAQIDVLCWTTLAIGSTTGAYEIRLSAGAGSFAQRRMSDGAGHWLDYNLYRDAARTQVWGDGAGATVVYLSGDFLLTLLQSHSVTLDVFGRVPASGLASATPGSYADAITVTIIF